MVSPPCSHRPAEGIVDVDSRERGSTSPLRRGFWRLNEYVVQVAVDQKLADPSLAVSDRTAQEAAVPHPNELGLMARFFGSVATLGPRAGAAVRGLLKPAAGEFQAAKRE